MLAATEKKFLHAILAAGAEYDVVKKLRSGFASFEQAWHSGAKELERASASAELAGHIVAARGRTNPDEELRKLVNREIAFIAADEPDFPQELREIAQPPFALYIKGRFTSGMPRLAVVGTRKATAYGREATRKIIRDLADHADICIVSGLAQGIDAEAHRAALDAGSPTIGILGSGMDRQSFFPPENWNLSEEVIANGGAVISEYPPGAPALPHHFPARNRIIAGLSRGTLVVEAPEKSGALITANFALEQGREVFALPGQVFSANALGTHRLIQDGAKLVTHAQDIIDELNLPRRTQTEKAATLLTDETERTILELLQEPKSVDELKLETAISTPEIITCLSLLELKGFIRPMGQNRFQRIS